MSWKPPKNGDGFQYSHVPEGFDYHLTTMDKAGKPTRHTEFYTKDEIMDLVLGYMEDGTSKLYSSIRIYRRSGKDFLPWMGILT